MDRLNYNHLRCFWAVAKEGSVAGACRALGLTQPTISKQVGDLEDALGEPLFQRTGRRLVLTTFGRTVHAYAEDIFALGQELLDSTRGHATGKPMRLHVGISDVVPKQLTRLALEPALTTEHPVHLVCREGKTDQLVADLTLTGLDMVLTDAPLPPGSHMRAFNHKLGESEVGVFGPARLAARCRRQFPGSLDGMPMLLPTENTALRRSIDLWLERTGLRPIIVAEFEDSALLKAFAEGGHGLFFAPMVVQRQLTEQLGVRLIGQVDEIREALFIITLERRITHPGVTAVVEAARGTLHS